MAFAIIFLGTIFTSYMKNSQDMLTHMTLQQDRLEANVVYINRFISEYFSNEVQEYNEIITIENTPAQ